MKNFDYIVWKEGKYFVSQCLNANVNSFGESFEEAISNLKEAVELYFEDETVDFKEVEQVLIGRDILYA